MSPTRAPPGDAVVRCRDVIDIIISAPGHKYNCERNELLQLLSQSHVQVSGNWFLLLLINWYSKTEKRDLNSFCTHEQKKKMMKLEILPFRKRNKYNQMGT